MSGEIMQIETRIEDFILRDAAADDIPVILSFIRELAEYEQLPHEVVATEKDLKETLFGERRFAEALIGEYRRQPAAFALFFHNFSTFQGRPGLYLEDLYVKPALRGKGFGKVMLAYLARLARERGCGRFEWAVLDWNEPALGFYRSIGAEPMDDWTVQRLTGEALDALAEKL